MTDPARILTATYNFEVGRRQLQRTFDPELITQTIISLRAVANTTMRAQQIIASAKRAPENVDVIVFAIAEIVAALPQDTQVRRDLLAQLPTPIQEHGPQNITLAEQPSERCDPVMVDAEPMHVSCAIVDPLKQVDRIDVDFRSNPMLSGEFGSQQTPLAEQPAEPIQTVLVDTELMRVLVALGYGAQALVYAVAQEMTRRSDGSGKVSETALLVTLEAVGVEVSRKTIHDRWINGGIGILWDYNKATKALYLYSPQRMTVHGLRGRLSAVQMALNAGRPELVTTNQPGTQMIYVPLALTLKAWSAQLYAAWYNSRGEHTTFISRFILCILWGVSKKTLIGWEKVANISKEFCFAQYTDFEHIPVEHAQPYLAPVTTAENKNVYEVRARAQRPNIYHAQPMKEHPGKRNPRERRRASKFVLENAATGDIPNGVCGATEAERNDVSPNRGVGFKATGRRIFFTNDGNLGKAFKRLRTHLHRDPDDNASHFVCLGFNTRRNCWILEQSKGDYQRTGLYEQIPRSRADGVFAAHGGRGSIVAAWRSIAS